MICCHCNDTGCNFCRDLIDEPRIISYAAYDHIQNLKAKLDLAKEALEFYANAESFLGKRAREALQKLNETIWADQ